MLTIREALELPAFHACRLVAGHNGLDNQIHWVHIVDIPDTTYEWRRRGVLLLTAGYGLRDRPEAQASLIPTLVRKGFAGMVLSTGWYFNEAPATIRQAADASGFPVIEAPPDLLFIDITESVLERVVNRQYALLQQSNEIHSQLTRLVLQGGDLHDLAQRLAGILERSISIESPSFHVLAAAQHGPVDEARERCLALGRTTPEMARHLLEAGVYDQLLERMGPLYVAPRPELGMTMERFVAPIIVDREIFGYIWIIAGDHPLTPLDELAIGQAATVAALILFKEKAVREAEEASRGDLLEQLLRGRPESASFAEQARQLGYDPARPHQVLLVHGQPEAGGNGRSLLDDVHRWLTGTGMTALLAWRDQHLVLVLEASEARQGRQQAAALVKALSHPARPLLVAIGGVLRPARGEAAGLRRSYEEALEALHVARMTGTNEGAVDFAELGMLHWLYHLPAEARRGNVYLDHVHTLAAYDAERHTELLKTMEAYLDHGGSLVETAETLFIHRNTLLHRLERIESLCHVDLRDPLQRLNLHAAVKSYRLFRE